MSGFDGLFRTQALTGSWAMEGARRREAARQFDVSAFQNQQVMQMRQAESDAKIGAWQQEQELNSHKLQMMQGLDSAKMSRLQTEQAELTLQAGKLDLEFTKNKMRGETEDLAKTKAEIKQIQQRAMGTTPQDKLASGYVPGPEGWAKARNSAELAQAKEDYANWESKLAEQDVEQRGLTRERLSREIHREMGIVTSYFASQADKAAARARLGILQSKWDVLTGAGKDDVVDEPAPGAIDDPTGAGGVSLQEAHLGSPDPQPDDPLKNPFPEESFAADLYTAILGRDAWTSGDPFWVELGEDLPQRASLATALVLYGSSLGDKGWQNEIDAAVMSAAETDPQVLGFILKISAGAAGSQRTDDDIRKVLRNKFSLTKQQVEFTMTHVNLAIKDVLSRDGQGLRLDETGSEGLRLDEETPTKQLRLDEEMPKKGPEEEKKEPLSLKEPLGQVPVREEVIQPHIQERLRKIYDKEHRKKTGKTIPVSKEEYQRAAVAGMGFEGLSYERYLDFMQKEYSYLDVWHHEQRGKGK